MINQFKNSSKDKWRNSKFIKFVEQVKNGDIIIENDQELHIKGGDNHNSLPKEYETSDQWIKEFQDMKTSNNEFMTPTEQWMQALQHAQQDDQNFFGFPDIIDHTSNIKDPIYEFNTTELNNPYIQSSVENDANSANIAYEQGIILLKEGKLIQAIEAFEACIYIDQEHADAWAKLGQARAENEDETAAIAALLKAVELDPYHLQALMMLGVSYTNDLEEKSFRLFKNMVIISSRLSKCIINYANG